jgi:hypothetical protein
MPHGATSIANLAVTLKPPCLLVSIHSAPHWHKAFVPIAADFRESIETIESIEASLSFSLVGVAFVFSQRTMPWR